MKIFLVWLRAIHTCTHSIHTLCCFWLCLRVNVGCGPAEERVLLTGLHAVADIYCENCKTTLGWKYVSSLGSFDSLTHRLHPRIENDEVEAGVAQYARFIWGLERATCTLMDCC